MKTLFFQESMGLFLVLSGVFLVLFIWTYKSRAMLWWVGLYIGLVVALCLFYRVPHRERVSDEESIVASSDGVVKQILELPDGRVRVVAFLNIFNQHLQFYPVSGVIEAMEYKKGSFHPAYLLEKSQYNERCLTRIRTKKGTVDITQIAGQVARRIVNHSKVGEQVRQGDYMGMIKLSSRVDLEFSKNYQIQVKIGDKLSALETIIARTK